MQNERAYFTRDDDLGEMVAAMTHGITQPLTAVVNYLSDALLIAAGGYGEEESAETERLIRDASEQALRAAEMVRTLRDFLDLNQGARSIERAERLVDSAMALVLNDARSLGVSIARVSNAADAEVEVDAIQIQQVLANLLRNAVEATSTGRREQRIPSVTISTTISPGDMVEFTVADNSPGNANDSVGRRLEPFTTTTPFAARLDLAICRRLVVLHDGILQGESIANGGSRFMFRLPRFTAGGL